MIWSRYNEIIKQEENTIFLFNCRTKQWLEIDSGLYRRIESDLTNPERLYEKHPELHGVMVDKKFYVSSTEKEISECISELKNKLADAKLLKLTVNPTLDCNLRCWYCYENHLQGSVMSEKTINAITKYIHSILKKKHYEIFQLSFFGGEPLLKFKSVIKPLLYKAQEICRELNIEFAVSFTTNGVCLTKPIREEIKEITTNVSFQIPLDGGREHHDSIKRFSGGKGSYDIVLNNAKGAVEDGFRVTIRCNSTKANIKSFHTLIKDFKNYHSCNNLRFSFHKVWQEAEDIEFKRGIIALKDAVTDITINSNLNTYFGNSVEPCYGDYFHNYVINYNGDVFKCTARDFNPENRIGFLTENGEIVFTEKALSRIDHNYTTDCFSCRRLPICPICSQVRSEAKDGRCPVKISPEEISSNIRQYFFDLNSQLKNVTL